MNGAHEIAILVPLAGLIPLGLAILVPFVRLVPVPVRSSGEGFARAIGTPR